MLPLKLLQIATLLTPFSLVPRVQAMNAKEKKRFEDMSAKDKQRFDKEMAGYVPKDGAGKRKKKAKDPNAPKRAL